MFVMGKLDGIELSCVQSELRMMHVKNLQQIIENISPEQDHQPLTR